MAKGYIYKATNKINGKSYIGKTINFDRRKHQHLTANCLAGLTKTSGGYMWNYKERKEVANA